MGSSQTTLLVHLWPLTTTVSSDTNGVTSVGEHRISRFSQWLPSVLRRMGEQWFRKYGGPMFVFLHLSVLFSSFVHIFLIKTESFLFFSFHYSIFPSPLKISLLFSLYSLYIPLPSNIVAYYVSVLGSQTLIFLSSKPNAALLLSISIFLQLLAEHLPVSQAGDSLRSTSFLIPR